MDTIGNSKEETSRQETSGKSTKVLRKKWLNVSTSELDL